MAKTPENEPSLEQQIQELEQTILSLEGQIQVARSSEERERLEGELGTARAAKKVLEQHAPGNWDPN